MYEKLEEIAALEQNSLGQFQHSVNVCMAAGCMSSQSDQIKEALDKAIAADGKEHWCHVRGTGCMGLCAQGPLVAVDADAPEKAVLYQNVTIDDVPDLVKSLDGKPVKRLICPTDVPFFARQQKIVLENSGYIDPERIEEYIARDGYAALLKVLGEMQPSDVIDEIVTSGLRGRGGGGYPPA